MTEISLQAKFHDHESGLLVFVPTNMRAGIIHVSWLVLHVVSIYWSVIIGVFGCKKHEATKGWKKHTEELYNIFSSITITYTG
jgi:hypothetical protein